VTKIGSVGGVFLLIGAVGLSACAIGTQRFGRPIDASRIPNVEVGVSTKADVLRDFGPPNSYSALPVVPSPPEDSAAGKNVLASAEAESRVFVYEYREDSENFFTVLLFTRFRREVLSDRLMVFLDPNDVVRYVAFSRETEGPAAQ